MRNRGPTDRVLADIAALFPAEHDAVAEHVAELRAFVVAIAERHTVPVFKLDDRGRQEFEGTGVLVQRGPAKYLASAAHVFDRCQRRPVLLDGSIGVLTNEPYVTNPPAGKPRDADTLDIGAVLLTEREAAALSADRFYELPPQALGRASSDFTLLLLLGFPARDQESDPTSAAHTMQAKATWLGYAEGRAYGLAGVATESHVLLSYREANIVEGTKRGAPGHLRGTSGGGVWRLALAPSGGLHQPPQLEAIFTERPDRYRPSLMATRVDVLVKFLDMNGLP